MKMEAQAQAGAATNKGEEKRASFEENAARAAAIQQEIAEAASSGDFAKIGELSAEGQQLKSANEGVVAEDHQEGLEMNAEMDAEKARAEEEAAKKIAEESAAEQARFAQEAAEKVAADQAAADKFAEEIKSGTKLKTLAASGGLDDFMAEIRPVEVAQDNVKNTEVSATETEARGELQQEKNRQAKEGIQPLIDKFKELSRERRSSADYYRGQKEYAVLKGDKEEYGRLHNEDINDWLAQSDIYEQALKEYREAGGEGDLQNEMYAGSTRESVLIFEKHSMGGVDGAFEGMKAGLAGKYDKGYKLPSDVTATAPDDYISKLVSNAVSEAGYKSDYDKVLGFVNPEEKKTKLKGYFEKRSQGFGIEALNHGDVVVAAKSLALAEAVGEIPADLQAQIRASYQKLPETKKSEFGTALDRERKAIGQKLEQALAQND